MKKYVYIFTRQDISPEQQLVQSAHVAMKLGVECIRKGMELDADNTYFTVVGVRDRAGMSSARRILVDYNFPSVAFQEPDLGGEITSVATYPIDEDQRSVLLAFSWLKF